MEKVNVTIKYGDVKLCNVGFITEDKKYVREILIKGHTDPKVCHGLSASLYFVAYAIRDTLLKPNDFEFRDTPGDSYFYLFGYSRDTEILMRTFVKVVEEIEKHYPDTIDILIWNKL